MKDPDNFNSWADDIYNSMDNAQRATPSPFLLTQVLHKQYAPSDNIWEKLMFWLTKPVIAISVLFFVIALNVLLISSSVNTQLKRSDYNNDIFYTSTTSIFDIDNITP